MNNQLSLDNNPEALAFWVPIMMPDGHMEEYLVCRDCLASKVKDWDAETGMIESNAADGAEWELHAYGVCQEPGCEECFKDLSVAFEIRKCGDGDRCCKDCADNFLLDQYNL